MHRFAPVALATILAATAPAILCAQTPFTPPQSSAHFTDPANLAGERVSPRTGRELPIDGGIGANGQPDNALGLAQLLRKLSTRASILNIVAHPDDEDGGMLTLNARGLGARVADLSLTRGEGGQNAMTGDFEDALGLLRTQELLANDRYTGVTQMFGTEVDFGFSKTKSEAFSKWNHQRVLYDVVRAIRIFRPLVITATFIGEPTDGHGQHQVSGEIAQEAFVAAGDPNVFPELTKEGILPWQPLKMYARAPFSRVSAQGLYDYATGQYVPAQFTNYVTGKTSSTPPTADITIHEGANDPLLTTCAANSSDLPASLRSVNAPLSSPHNTEESAFLLSSFRAAGGSASPAPTDCKPLSYVQFARIGLGLQRSQIGPGVRNARSGAFDASYHLYGSRLCNAPSDAVILSGAHSAESKDPCISPAPAHSAEGALSGPALANHPSFFDGIETSIEGIATLLPEAPASVTESLRGVAARIAEAQHHFTPADPEKIAPLLAEAETQLIGLLAQLETRHATLETQEYEGFHSQKRSLEKEQLENVLHELRVKSVQLNEALRLSLGFQS